MGNYSTIERGQRNGFGRMFRPTVLAYSPARMRQSCHLNSELGTKSVECRSTYWERWPPSGAQRKILIERPDNWPHSRRVEIALLKPINWRGLNVPAVFRELRPC